MMSLADALKVTEAYNEKKHGKIVSRGGGRQESSTTKAVREALEKAEWDKPMVFQVPRKSDDGKKVESLLRRLGGRLGFSVSISETANGFILWTKSKKEDENAEKAAA